jgi:hypothetical protein
VASDLSSTATTHSATRPVAARGLARRSWTVALGVAIPLAATYLIVAPSAGDLAAATYRSDLFARVGFTTWDTGWYAAHGYWLPSYSLLSPALGAWLGVRILLAFSTVAASALFGLIAERAFGPAAARLAAALFALGFCVSLLSGRVPYDLGFAIGLGAILALLRGRLALALGLAMLTSAASPVAGAFLALVGVAYMLVSVRRGLALATVALAPVAALSLAYPNGGYEPFAASAFWPALAGVVLIAVLLPQGPLSPRGWLALRVGAGLYALVLIGAYAIHTPLGGNAARLGPLLAMPLLAGVMWERRGMLFVALAPVLLYWQMVTPIRDYSSIVGDPSVNASYYAPLLSELRRLRHGSPTIVEVPMTAAHWEAAYLPGHDGISLARGWERQLDTRYAALFYRPTLSSSAYHAWLLENRVLYVALADVRLDGAGRLEGALVAHGVPYLRELWHSEHWRLYRVMG